MQAHARLEADHRLGVLDGGEVSCVEKIVSCHSVELVGIHQFFNKRFDRVRVSLWAHYEEVYPLTQYGQVLRIFLRGPVELRVGEICSHLLFN